MKNNKKPKVSFPHMGTIYVVWGSIINSLGGTAIIPPYSSKKTLSLGTKYSPEAICLPYKLVLGNFIEAIEKGADLVIMLSSPGICRLGEYGRTVKSALENLNLVAEYYDIDLYKGKFKEMYKCIIKMTGVRNPVRIIKALILGIKKVFVLDKLENIVSYYRAREINTGGAEKIHKKIIKKIFEAYTSRDLKLAQKEGIKELRLIPLDVNREILHVDLTGEIFMVLDPFANQNIERELGRLGVQVRRSLTISSWLKDAIIPKIFLKGETHLQRAVRLARPYLTRDIGGDAIESISDIINADSKGTDGIIHISPFTCMPEIMSQNIFPTMREECKIPILPLIMDEQTGRAGYVTRLEAFVDLMKRRKRMSEGKND
ncbi:MAG: acyl-CoA dehydratase activase-related protein [Candidatus Gastranaerophilales bacterium]|nr:acyl-CoA dehydratase activase-related protein [Candidatus Gastranaerophilales bacterium]